jgi:hypothetical protein
MSNPPERLGYGDAATPDGERVADPYGYGDARPDAVDYGYGDARPDEIDYGYGDATPDVAVGDEYGIDMNDHDPSSPEGLVRRRRLCRRRTPGRTSSNESMTSVQTADSYGEYVDDDGGVERRQRYRRRGSVTRYSVEQADEVQALRKEHDEYADVIDRFRTQCHVEEEEEEEGPSIHDDDDDGHYVHHDAPAVVGTMTPQHNVTISPLQDGDSSPNNKTKKKNRFKNLRRRFSIR